MIRFPFERVKLTKKQFHTVHEYVYVTYLEGGKAARKLGQIRKIDRVTVLPKFNKQSFVELHYTVSVGSKEVIVHENQLTRLN